MLVAKSPRCGCNAAAKRKGESIKAGQKVQYIITDYSRKTKRAVPLTMVENKYEVKRYTKLLAKCCTTVTKPFGIEIITTFY